MTRDILTKLYAVNHAAVHTNLKGVTHEDSLLRPKANGNCLNWVLGHIVATRNQILKLAGAKAIWSDEQVAPYARGAKASHDGRDLETLGKVLADFDESQEILLTVLPLLTDADLARTSPDDKTVADRLFFLHFHEAYHIGQIGLLRRIIGLEGSIK